MCNATKPRLTTREAAKLLQCRKPSDTVALLRAAGVEATRCGAAWLWSSAGVERLAAALGKATPSAAPSGEVRP